MPNERFENEKKQLLRLKTLLDNDRVLPLRFELRSPSIDYSRFQMVINGLRSLVADPGRTSSCIGQQFNLSWSIPVSQYPYSCIPEIKFLDPIPFHPHVYTSGKICWGTQNTPQPDMFLVDWFRSVIEYLQYNRDGLVRMNRNSPANSDAKNWWVQNQSSISRYIPAIDMARLRFWVDRSRG